MKIKGMVSAFLGGVVATSILGLVVAALWNCHFISEKLISPAASQPETPSYTPPFENALSFTESCDPHSEIHTASPVEA